MKLMLLIFPVPCEERGRDIKHIHSYDSGIPALHSGGEDECLIRKQFAMQPEAVLLKAAENASDYCPVHDAMECYNWKKLLLVAQICSFH